MDPAVKGPIVSISLIDLSHYTKKGGEREKKKKYQYGYLVTNLMLFFIINMLNILFQNTDI